MRVRIIIPVIDVDLEPARRAFARAAAPGTEVSVVSLAWGTSAIEGRADDAWAAPGVLSRAIEAERDGVDAVVIDCMNDPALHAAREVVRIPVVGPAEASMHLAAMLAHRFTIITTGSADIPSVEELVACCRMSGKLASVRAIDIPVLALGADQAATFRALADAGEQAVRQDGAGALIPGCTLLAELAGEAQRELARRGCEVPVLDPCAVAIKAAETQVSLGLCHSARTYARPGDKPIAWPIREGFM